MLKKITLTALFILTMELIFCEVIVLKDKTVIKGVITRSYFNTIVIKVNYGEIYINKKEVYKIYKDEEYKEQNEITDEKTLSENEQPQEKPLENKDPIALKKEAESVRQKLFWSGLTVSWFSPYFLILGGTSLLSGDPRMFLFAWLAAFTTSGLGMIPYGGPIALSVVYTGFAISFFALCGTGYTFPLFIPMGISSLFVALAEVLSAILEFSSRPAAENYYNRNKKKFSLFLYPEMPINKKDETAITGGFTCRF